MRLEAAGVSARRPTLPRCDGGLVPGRGGRGGRRRATCSSSSGQWEAALAGRCARARPEKAGRRSGRVGAGGSGARGADSAVAGRALLFEPIEISRANARLRARGRACSPPRSPRRAEAPTRCGFTVGRAGALADSGVVESSCSAACDPKARALSDVRRFMARDDRPSTRSMEAKTLSTHAPGVPPSAASLGLAGRRRARARATSRRASATSRSAPPPATYDEVFDGAPADSETLSLVDGDRSPRAVWSGATAWASRGRRRDQAPQGAPRARRRPRRARYSKLMRELQTPAGTSARSRHGAPARSHLTPPQGAFKYDAACQVRSTPSSPNRAAVR